MVRPKEVHAWLYLLAYIIIVIVAFFWRSITQQLGISFESFFHILFSLIILLSFSFAFFGILFNIKSKDPLVSLFYLFLTLGIGFALSGVITTLLILSVIATLDVSHENNIKELLSIYLQVSLHFLLGGISLVGVALPVLPSLVGQRERRVEPSPQSSGESGGSQQSK